MGGIYQLKKALLVILILCFMLQTQIAEARGGRGGGRGGSRGSRGGRRGGGGGSGGSGGGGENLIVLWISLGLAGACLLVVCIYHCCCADDRVFDCAECCSKEEEIEMQEPTVDV